MQILTPDLLDIDRLIQNALRVFLEICKEYLRTAPKVQCQLQIAYQDYDISDIDVGKISEKINILLENLTPPKLMQIPGTEGQSQSQKWFQERWVRLTVSKCLSAFRMERLITEAPNAAVRAFKFIRTNIWKIDIVPIQTHWMKYGFECEPKAIDKYEKQTKTTVCDSGLWVNPRWHY